MTTPTPPRPLSAADRGYLAAITDRALTFPGFIDSRVEAEARPATERLAAALRSGAPLDGDQMAGLADLLETAAQEPGFYGPEGSSDATLAALTGEGLRDQVADLARAMHETCADCGQPAVLRWTHHDPEAAPDHEARPDPAGRNWWLIPAPDVELGGPFTEAEARERFGAGRADWPRMRVARGTLAHGIAFASPAWAFTRQEA
jgi:hypothetical protein